MAVNIQKHSCAVCGTCVSVFAQYGRCIDCLTLEMLDVLDCGAGTVHTSRRVTSPQPCPPLGSASHSSALLHN